VFLHTALDVCAQAILTPLFLCTAPLCVCVCVRVCARVCARVCVCVCVCVCDERRGVFEAVRRILRLDNNEYEAMRLPALILLMGNRYRGLYNSSPKLDGIFAHYK